MTNKPIKKIAHDFINKHRLTNIDFFTLERVIENLGYSVVYFNSVSNDSDVELIIQKLNLCDIVLKSRGFTYADNDFRIVFINEDLNEDEKRLVIAHELGHIVCKHYCTVPIIGNDVKEEYEANEFSHYLLNKTFTLKLKGLIWKYPKGFVCITLILILLTSMVFVLMSTTRIQSFYGDYYVTPYGVKYHQIECIYVKYHKKAERLTKEQFATGKYTPCNVCLPK